MVKRENAKEACEAKKLAKKMAMAKLGSSKKLPKTPKGEKEKTFEPLTLKVGKEGHQQIKSLPRGKPPKATSRWWNNLDPPLTPHNQVKKKRRTQRLSIF
jgi:hypothetical protein